MWQNLRVQGLAGKGLPSSLSCLPNSMLRCQEMTLPTLRECIESGYEHSGSGRFTCMHALCLILLVLSLDLRIVSEWWEVKEIRR